MASYRWHPGGRPRRQLRRVARGEVAAALAAFELDDPQETVHVVRQHSKKLRALLRLVRLAAPERSRRASAEIRDTARRLAGLRDATVALETFDDLARADGAAASDADATKVEDDRLAAWDAVRCGFERRRDAQLRTELDPVVAVVRAELETLHDRIGAWDVEGTGFDVLAAGLGRTHRRCRERMEVALRAPGTPAFHAWRKAAKDHRYHLELLHELWPAVLGAQEDELHRLTDLLGEDHDLAVLRGDLHAEPEAYGGPAAVAVVTAVLDPARARRQHGAATLGRRCVAEPTDVLVARLHAWWELSSSRGPDAGSSARPPRRP
jgi:CHAD domain-containing protein